MASSSAKQNYPVAPQGFGQTRHHFKYDDDGSVQHDWAKRAYSDGARQEEDPPKKKTEHAQQVAQPRAANDEKILSPYDRLMFATDVSIRYHNRRKTHYENVFKLAMTGVVIMAFGTLTASFGGRIWLLAGVAALGLGTLVWNISTRSREHAVISTEYQSLAEMIRQTQFPADNDIRNWRNMRQRIHAKEPPVFWAVMNDCYFETARAWGMRPKQRGLPPVWLRPFVNWIRF